MSDTTADWFPWRVVPDSGFEVADRSGNVGIVQVDHKRFEVQTTFRFGDDAVEQKLVGKLVDRGMAPDQARIAVDEARTYTPGIDPATGRTKTTDLASIPRMMRWFENPYGVHSLAALIHDELITKTADGGRLGSDTLSDQFFRIMMKASGVPYLKRWIMWAAVAGRTRIAAGGLRRWSVLVWIALCTFGLVCVVDALGAWLFGWPAPIDPWWLIVIATALPIVSARLWGDQWGASMVWTVAAFWIVPAAAFAGSGYLVYAGLERLAHRAGYH